MVNDVYMRSSTRATSSQAIRPRDLLFSGHRQYRLTGYFRVWPLFRQEKMRWSLTNEYTRKRNVDGEASRPRKGQQVFGMYVSRQSRPSRWFAGNGRPDDALVNLQATFKAELNFSSSTWEFDPGSERTLAAGLTHASRTRTSVRVADGWVTRRNLPISAEQHREICANTAYVLWEKDLSLIDGPALD